MKSLIALTCVVGVLGTNSTSNDTTTTTSTTTTTTTVTTTTIIPTTVFGTALVYPIGGTLTISTVTWSSDLTNSNSVAFKAAETTICNALRTAVTGSFTYTIGCKVNSIAQASTGRRRKRTTGVQANYTVNVKSDGSGNTPSTLFSNAMSKSTAVAALTAVGASDSGTFTQGTPVTTTGCQTIGGVSMCGSAEKLSSLFALVLLAFRYL